MDEAYLKDRGEWVCLYCAVDRECQTFDFMLSAKQDTAAASKFLAIVLCRNRIPTRITIDISRSNTAGIKEMNGIFRR